VEHVLEGVYDDLIEREDDGHLDEELQASREGAVVLLLVHSLDLLGDLHLSCFIGSARVLFADRHFLRTEFCLFNGVSLLLDGEGEENDLNYDGEDKECPDIVSCDRIKPAKE